MIAIRELAPSDAARLIALEATIREESRLLGVGIALSYEFLANPFSLGARFERRILLGAEAKDGELQGVISAGLQRVQTRDGLRASAYLHSLRVRPSARRRGIGSQLVEAAVHHARERGADLCWGAVSSGNRRSRSVGVRAGFHSMGFVSLSVAPARWPIARTGARSSWRRLTNQDSDAVQDLLCRFYRGVQFWAPWPHALQSGGVVTKDEAVLVAGSPQSRMLATLRVTSLKDIVRPRLSTSPSFLLDIGAPVARLLRVADPRRPLRAAILSQLAWERGAGELAIELLEAARRMVSHDHDVLVFAWDPNGPLAPIGRRLVALRASVELGASDLTYLERGAPLALELP
jgi:GNAT superfamily N-acetyltransferase